jgi:hypothetical protein
MKFPLKVPLLKFEMRTTPTLLSLSLSLPPLSLSTFLSDLSLFLTPHLEFAEQGAIVEVPYAD